MQIAIIGAGRVGKTLGTALQRKGHTIVYGVRNPKTSISSLNKTPGEQNTKTVSNALAGAHAVILAIPWTAAEALVCENAEGLAGTIVIDATNPLNPASTSLAFGFVTSAAELLQSQAQQATFYKAFNTTGYDVMAHPQFPQGKAVMFVAGPDGLSKKTVMRLVADVGFEAVDAGELKAARLLEPLAMLWIQLASVKRHGRDFAFIMARRESIRNQHAGPRVAAIDPQEVE